jgi:cell division protein FtsL
MNTMVRALPASRFALALQNRRQVKKHSVQLILVWILIFVTAFSVVYAKDLYRRTFLHYQDLQQQQNQLYTDWGKLMLEQSTWSTQARVQKIAASRLAMQVPAPKTVVLVE